MLLKLLTKILESNLLSDIFLVAFPPSLYFVYIKFLKYKLIYLAIHLHFIYNYSKVQLVYINWIYLFT